MQEIFEIVYVGVEVYFEVRNKKLSIKELNNLGYRVTCILSNRENQYQFAICDYNSSTKKLGVGGN